MSDSSIPILCEILEFVNDKKIDIRTSILFERKSSLVAFGHTNPYDQIANIGIRNPKIHEFWFEFNTKLPSFRIDIPNVVRFDTFLIDNLDLNEFIIDLKEMDRNMFKLTHNFDINILEVYPAIELELLFLDIQNIFK